MDAEKCYDILDRCNGIWRDGNENTISFFRPANGLKGMSILCLSDNTSYDLVFKIEINNGNPTVCLNNRIFNLTISEDGESMQMERLGKVTDYSLQETLSDVYYLSSLN